MVGLISILLLGFVLGMRHATDPDHVVAISTIVSQQRNLYGAAWIGAIWGLGHTITICAVGTGIIIGGWIIPVRAGLSMELSVGLMLIVLGLANLASFLRSVPIQPANREEAGLETVSSSTRHTHLFAGGRRGIFSVLRPFVVGVVHGLAGSAAVALLVLATIREPRWAFLYLLIFGAGTIAGMMIVTAAISLPFCSEKYGCARFNRGLRIATGAISVGFGLFLTYNIGFVSGFFTNHPRWTPR